MFFPGSVKVAVSKDRHPCGYRASRKPKVPRAVPRHPHGPLAQRRPLPLHSTWLRATTKRYSPVTRDFKDNSIEDCITFNAKIMGVIKLLKRAGTQREPLVAGRSDTAPRLEGRDPHGYFWL